MSTKVVDGAIRNATVCIDMNANGACDPGEPSAKTDAQGSAVLQIPTGDVGKYVLLATIGTDAIDADSGPVRVPYTMSAPADSTALVSPLTTVVQRIAADTGVTTAQAETAARSQTALTVSMLSDYTADTTAQGRVAAATARLIVVSTQQQTQGLATAIGTTDLSGAPITPADLTVAIQRNVVKLITELVTAALDPEVQAACAAAASEACSAAIDGQATQVVAAGGLTLASLPVVVGASRTPDAPADSAAPITAGASLDFMNFGDSDNWSYRIYASTAAENTPDAKGLVRYRAISRKNTAGNLVEWSDASSYARRNDTHWNGSAWVICTFGLQMAQTARDANGRVASSDYCDGLQTSNSQRSVVDVSGKKIVDIAAAIRASQPNYATWGSPPSDYTGSGSANYGTAVFPAGSKFFSQTTVRTATAPVYDVTSPVFRYSSAVTAGGDARNGGALSCNSVETTANPAIQSTTLEDLIANFKGTPCIFNQGSLTSTASPTPLLSPVPNEWWGNSTLGIATFGSAPLLANPTSYLTGNTYLNVAFTGTNSVTYYSCQQRQQGGSYRNCTALGTGAYSIATVGDARVLTITGAPAIAASLTYDRIFVERGGKVYFGYKTRLYQGQSTRLNLPATNALFTQIGIPVFTP